jgi:hypothetical protein
LRDPFLSHCNPLGVSDPSLLLLPFGGCPALFGFGFLGTPPVVRRGAVVNEPLIDGFNLVLGPGLDPASCDLKFTARQQPPFVRLEGRAGLA